MDNLSNDGSTKNLPCNVWKYDYPFVHFDKLTEMCNWWQRWFLYTLTPKYDMVLYADIDEIFYHRLGLHVFMESLHNKGFKGTIKPVEGLEITHYLPEEPDLDLQKPIMEQRKYCKNNGHLWQKATLTNTLVTWTPGCHETKSSMPIIVDKDYRLIHLHMMDYKICEKRHIYRNKLVWAHQNGAHSKEIGEKLKGWFMHKHKNISNEVKKVPI